MNLKLIEIMRANAEAFFNFAEDMANARDPGTLTAVWTKHIQNQMELLNKQGLALASFGQTLATTAVDKISDRMR